MTRSAGSASPTNVYGVLRLGKPNQLDKSSGEELTNGAGPRVFGILSVILFSCAFTLGHGPFHHGGDHHADYLVDKKTRFRQCGIAVSSRISSRAAAW